MPTFIDISFDASMLHTNAPETWSWNVDSFGYYRVAVDAATATVQFYIEQGSNEITNNGDVLGPTHLVIDLPQGIQIAAYTQGPIQYTQDPNYLEFPGDGSVRAMRGASAIEVYHMAGDGPNAGRWLPGRTVAFWFTFTFPIVTE